MDLWSQPNRDQSDTEWLAAFSPWSSSRHVFMEDTADNIAQMVARGQRQRWGVVFIDDSPGGDARARQVELFLPIADYVVMHDAEDSGNNYAPVSEVLARLKCPHVLFYNRYHPWTLAASMTQQIPDVP